MESFKAPTDAIDICHFVAPEKDTSSFTKAPSIWVNPAADGSAYLEYERVKITCSVIGPVEIRLDGQITTSFKFVPFCSQIRYEKNRDLEEKRLSQLLLSALEPCVILNAFPCGKYQIEVTVIDDGSLPGAKAHSTSCLSAGITCASLALVHAGVQMYDMAIGLRVKSSDLCVETDDACISIAVMPHLRQLTMLDSPDLSMIAVDKLRRPLEHAFEMASELHTTLQSMLFSYID